MKSSACNLIGSERERAAPGKLLVAEESQLFFLKWKFSEHAPSA